jgi:putative ABC transport system permease protein
MTLLQDIRYAVRLLVKDRWFTLTAATALALGIGMNATVFTFVNAVLIRGLPFSDPDRILWVGMMDARGRQQGVSRLDFQDWRERARSYSGMALVFGSVANVSDEGRPAEQFSGAYISANLFAMIGQKPIAGRDFEPDDDRTGAEAVVLLGNGIWKNRYGSDASILGRSIKINSAPATVIGIMPPDMKFPNNADVWLPLSQLPPEVRDSKRNARTFQAIARLGDGVSLGQARSELSTIVAALARDHPDTNKDLQPQVMKFNDRVNGGPIRVIFLALMGAVSFVLLIACANVANLLLARAAQRAREMSVRVSLGATRWRIVRQLIVESVLLAAVSGLLGLLLASAGVRWFDSVTQDVGKPYWIKFTMDGTVFAFFAAVCLGTSFVFGLAPALHVSRTDVNEVLKEAGGRSGTGGRRARRWTSALIVVELALTLALLAGAGLMLRSFLALYRADLAGIDASRILTMRLTLPLAKYSRPEARVALYERMEERLRGIGSIEASTLASHAPMQGGFDRELTVEGRREQPGVARPSVTVVTVGTGYFDALQLPVVRGRAFAATDGTAGHESAIVNQRFAAMHFAGEDPIGRRIQMIDATPRAVGASTSRLSATIVGIVPTIRQRNFQEPDPDPVAYVPYRADPQRVMNLLIRGSGDVAALTSLVRNEMRTIDPDLPLFNIRTLEAALALERWPFRVFGAMFALFAVVALVLAAIGLYAVTSYAVAQRTQEIGIRMALGAQPPQVWWLFIRQSLVQLAVGLTLGLAGAVGVGVVLRSILVQTGARDPVTLVTIVLVLTGVALAASYWPARRATSLDPLKALRCE